MSKLYLPSWVSKHKGLEELIQGHAEALKKYADGFYGGVENTARFHRAKDKAFQAMNDLADALETVRNTMPAYVVGDVGSKESRRNRQDIIDRLAEIDASINKEHDFIASNLVGVFSSGMDLYVANQFLMGIDQKLKEISVFSKKLTNRPSKRVECYEIYTINMTLNKLPLSKNDIDLIIDAMFAYAELPRPDRKTVMRYSKKKMEAERLARAKAPQ